MRILKVQGIILLPIIAIFIVAMFPGFLKEHGTMFSKLDSVGIQFQNTLSETNSFNILNYPYFYNGGGVAIGDINNDGLADIVFTGNQVKNRLYLNKGDWKFEDITQKSGISDKDGWSTGITMVDINYDGLLDIYICRSADIRSSYRSNLLFVNNGDLTFTESAHEYGLDDTGFSTQATFFDYDRDGDLDCFVINHSIQFYGAGEQFKSSKRDRYDARYAFRLYKNTDDHFEDVSAEAGIVSNLLTSGLGISVADLNQDGWPDIYASNDYNEPDYLFMNQGDGTFKESLANSMDQASLNSMGTDIADINNDGLMDIFSLDMASEFNREQKLRSGPDNFTKFQTLFNSGFYYQYGRNMLHLNNGDGTFSEIGQFSGISQTDWSWAALFADFDQDGQKDLFISNGYMRDYTNMDFINYKVNQVLRQRKGEDIDNLSDFITQMPVHKVSNYMYRNKGGALFNNVANSWGLGGKTISNGAAYGDLDNDGDLDLVTNNINEIAGIYRNNSKQIAPANHLKIGLVSSSKNTFGIGTRITAYAQNQLFYQDCHFTRGFQSSVDPIVNIGLGKNQSLDSLVVQWPDGTTQAMYNVESNQTIVIQQEDATLRENIKKEKKQPLPLLTTTEIDGLAHRENSFNDFDVQSLLIQTMSDLGPCIAKGDIDGDGIDEVYAGGAKGQAGAIYSLDIAKTPKAIKIQEFENEKEREDTAAEFFDADGDGDLDLYVGSGGYEYRAGDPALQDRLYFNNGKGYFVISESAIPKIYQSTSCIGPIDFDQDGDTDLFIGGRVVPGAYPKAPKSSLLVNQGDGRFEDNISVLAPTLEHIGMVTDAEWLDINGDGMQDLILVGEWMPIKTYLNLGKKIVDHTVDFLDKSPSGFWNSLDLADMDGDGDMDMIAGNYGRNALFNASENEPMRLYFKDFDENGSVDPILCYYINGISYPMPSRDDLVGQLPGLKKKFPSYGEYASATITDLFSPSELDSAEIFEISSLESTYFENIGTSFKAHALPDEAQYAPVYTSIDLDVDNDGIKDLLLFGNHSTNRIKFGRQRANHGVLLKGLPDHSFTYVPQHLSGLDIRGDVKAAKKISLGNEQGVLLGINNAKAKLISTNKKNKNATTISQKVL